MDLEKNFKNIKDIDSVLDNLKKIEIQIVKIETDFFPEFTL